MSDDQWIDDFALDIEVLADQLQIATSSVLPTIPDTEVDDPACLARLCVEAERLHLMAKEIREVIGETLARALPYGTQVLEVEGLPTITPSWPKDRKEWDSEGLRDDVRRRILSTFSAEPLVDPNSGEQVTPRLIAEQAIDATEVAVSINGSNIKTGGLRELDLDPDEYCATTARPPKVTIEKESPA